MALDHILLVTCEKKRAEGRLPPLPEEGLVRDDTSKLQIKQFKFKGR